MTLATGARLGPYEIQSPLGTGGIETFIAHRIVFGSQATLTLHWRRYSDH
jgi:hypothetical protein